MKRGLLLATTLVLIGVIAFRWWLPTERVITPRIILPDARLDYRLQDYEIQFHDAEGRPDLMVRGPRLEHDADSRVVTLIDPEFQLSTESTPWQGRADRAEFDRDFDSLSLLDDVELWRDQAIGRLVLNTESLQHQRPARTINTDVPVRLTRPGTEVNSGGLMIQLDSETVDLKNDVHLHARPAKQND